MRSECDIPQSRKSDREEHHTLNTSSWSSSSRHESSTVCTDGIGREASKSGNGYPEEPEQGAESGTGTGTGTVTAT